MNKRRFEIMTQRNDDQNFRQMSILGMILPNLRNMKSGSDRPIIVQWTD